MLQGGDFAAAAYNLVVDTSSAAGVDCDEILPVWNRFVKDKHRIDLRGVKYAGLRNLDCALARLLRQPHAFVIARKIDSNVPSGCAQLMSGCNHVKSVGRFVEDV